MSGRGRGKSRWSGRGGRGSYNNDGGSKGTATIKKTKLEHHIYQVGTAHQASDYETNTQFIINHIKKEYDDGGDDIAKALEDLEHVDIDAFQPRVQISQSTDVNIKTAENTAFLAAYTQRNELHLKREANYCKNRIKAYGLLWEQCSSGMRSKIEQRTDFKTSIKDDPVELLKAIKQHALNYQETRYEMAIVTDALKAVLLAKQKEAESLNDYTKRFKTATEVLESHVGGPII